MRRITLSLLILVFVAILQVSLVRAQAPAAASERKSFDVATIEPSKSGEMRVSMRIIPGGAYEAFNSTHSAARCPCSSSSPSRSRLRTRCNHD
jgi:hypothetical protein